MGEGGGSSQDVVIGSPRLGPDSQNKAIWKVTRSLGDVYTITMVINHVSESGMILQVQAPGNGWLGDDPFLLGRPTFWGEVLVLGREYIARWRFRRFLF